MIRTIEPKAAQALLAEGGVTLLDVRTEEEHALGHIAGCTLLPLDELREKVQTLLPEKDRPIMVYCRSGARSRTAAGILERLGYETIYDLGGVVGWPYGLEHI